jgi:hypothetical protein
LLSAFRGLIEAESSMQAALALRKAAEGNQHLLPAPVDRADRVARPMYVAVTT